MSPLRIRRGRRRITALLWAVLTISAIVYYYWDQCIGVISNNAPAQGYGHGHPHAIQSKKIWQVTGDSKVQAAMDCAGRWIASNPGWAHTLHTDTTAAAFAARHRGDDHLARVLGELRNSGVRADLIRYLLLGVEGGIYTDLDTVPLKEIDEWLPWGHYLDRGARLVVGVEWDELATGSEEGESGGGNSKRPKGVLHEVQFCQWTIVAARAGHPVFGAMIERALALLEEQRSFWGARTLRQVVLSELEVLNITGPAAWTDVVLAHMRSVDPAGLGSLGELSGLNEPRLVGDVLVLPVNAFASGTGHSGATREEDGTPNTALVKHLFKGSWREGNKNKPLC